jgi:hypothetical protein
MVGSHDDLELLAAHLVGLRPVLVVLFGDLGLLDYPFDLLEHQVTHIHYTGG